MLLWTKGIFCHFKCVNNPERTLCCKFCPELLSCKKGKGACSLVGEASKYCIAKLTKEEFLWLKMLGLYPRTTSLSRGRIFWRRRARTSIKFYSLGWLSDDLLCL